MYILSQTYKVNKKSKFCMIKLYLCSGHMEWCAGRSSVWGAHLTLELIIVTLLSILWVERDLRNLHSAPRTCETTHNHVIWNQWTIMIMVKWVWEIIQIALKAGIPIWHIFAYLSFNGQKYTSILRVTPLWYATWGWYCRADSCNGARCSA